MRNRDSLPTPRDLTLLLARVSARVSIASVLAMSIYLYLLLRLSTEQWLAFGKVVGGLFVVLFVAVGLVTHGMQRAVLRYLEREAEGRATEAELHAAYWTLSRLALWMSVSGVLWWAGGGVLVAATMSWLFDSLSAFALVVMVAASTSGGVVSMVFSYYMYKRALADLTSELGGRIGDPDRRRDLQRPVSLGLKTVVSVASVTIVVVYFSMQLALVTTSTSLERFATNLQARFLANVSQRFEIAGVDVLPALADELQRSGIASGILVVDTQTGEVVASSTEGSDAQGLYGDELALVVEGPVSGDSTRYDSGNAFAWQRTRDGRHAIVAYSSWAGIRGDTSDVWAVFALTMFVASLLAASVARFLAGDVASSARDLQKEVNRTAAGDLRPGELLQSEDEIGDLAVAFFRMRAALYAMVSRVVEAADHVDNTADRIRDISGRVETSGLEQGRGVERARQSIQQMEGQISGISATAEELGQLVEDSSASVVELSAAGRELSNTAGTLIDRVIDQSSSIEEIVQSVRQVGENTDSLAEAAAETSSSMEEMASSMRQVDSTAEVAARLSADVVEAAKAGQATMGETVEAMESIRSATQIAEEVIAVLGGRAEEIGAIVDVIDDVADETSLLALNAAIIAAQAGEQGRAFSVVADEIKELADRVQVSTKEIGELIRSVQGESANAVRAIERGAKSVAAGIQRVTDTGTSLHEITRTSRESGERITEIVKSVREQTKAAVHVVTMMERVSVGSEGIRRANAEQGRAHEVVQRSSFSMREVAEQMQSTIQEQGKGTEQIRESIVGVLDVSESIRRVLQAQVASCSDVVGFLDGTSEAARSNEESAGQLGDATRELIDQAESLRNEVKNFKL